ncbi:MAG: amidohydrolase family protein [Bacteroidales bacterium]|nr:amidohydrolase family protein [Bacteroidales bacterium]
MRICAKYLYTLASDAPVRDGYVELAPDGTVTGVGQSRDPSSEPVYYDGAVVPGFVNSHCHVELSYMKGLFRRGTGMAGFIDQINALRDTAGKQEKLFQIGTWMDRMWDRGVVAMADISNCDDSFRIKASHPMYTRTFLEVFGTEPEDCPAVMDSVNALWEKARALGLDAAPTPHACYTMSPELLEAASVAGLSSGYLSYHSEESQEEDLMVRSGCGPMWENRRRSGMSTPPVTGTSSLEYFLDILGKALPVPVDGNVLLVHEVCLDRSGAAAARRVLSHPFVAVCPRSNIFIHNALPPISLMREIGLTITVGTDSLSSNDDLDMVGELFCLQENFPEVPLSEMFRWACLNGASFLGKASVLGTIEPGKRPGIVFIDHLSPDGKLTVSSVSKRIA